MYYETLGVFEYSLVIFAYLLGTIPFGLLLGKYFKNIDVREYGSKNIGATNVTRVLGKKLGIITFILDGLKGVTMILISRFLFKTPEAIVVSCAIAAVLGHVFPIWLRFKGGKGVATTLVTLIAVNWILGLFMAFTWLVTFFTFRISSLAALTAILATTYLATFFDSVEINYMMLFLCTLILFRHGANIKRLLGGKEKTFKKDTKVIK